MTSITEQGQQVGVRGCWEGGAHFTGGVGIWLNSPLAPPQTHSDWHLAALELKKGEIKKSPQSEEGFGVPSSMELRFLPLSAPSNPQILSFLGARLPQTARGHLSVSRDLPLAFLLSLDTCNMGVGSGGKRCSHGPPSAPHPTSQVLGRYNQP